MTRGLRRGWQVATAAMLLICLFWMWQSLQLSLFDRLGPGPGFFPFWLSLIGSVLSAVAFVQAALRPSADESGETVFPRGEAARRVLAILIAIAVAAAVIGPLGFELTILAFALALPVALGDRRWWALAIFALASSFGIFYLFTRWLDVGLPPGPFGG